MLYIIIVIYKTRLENSLTYKTLKNNLERLKTLGTKLLIYNNSSEIEIPPTNDYVVHTPTENLMLAGAYNYALNDAEQGGYKWLLLLDQDTELTEEYFSELLKFFSTKENDNYDIVLPILRSREFYLSPIICKKDIGPFAYIGQVQSQDDMSKLEDSSFIVAYNSVSLLSVSVLKQIGGFGNQYQLDMLDYYYYYKLSQINCKVYILPVCLKQNISLLEKTTAMSKIRYNNYLLSSLNFAKLLGIKSVFYFKVRLLIDFVRQFSNKNIYKGILIKYLFKW